MEGASGGDGANVTGKDVAVDAPAAVEASTEAMISSTAAMMEELPLPSALMRNVREQVDSAYEFIINVSERAFLFFSF